MRSSPRLLAVSLVALACSRTEHETRQHAPTGASRGVPAAPLARPAPLASTASSAPPAAPPAPAADTPSKRYAWLKNEAGRALELDAPLSTRFPPPPGYTRVAVEPGSFSDWLRGIPLAPPGTAVTSHDGNVVRRPDDDYVAAVLAIDVGTGDVQQSSDVIVRLHAEWLWWRGETQSITYRGPNKLALPLSRWEKGQRLVAGGPTGVFWAVKTKPKALDYAEFRRYLDAVLLWNNSTSLAQSSEPLTLPEALAPGDFFLHGGAPGHVVIVLDVAKKPSGERVALLGQALNPAQSVHVLRPGRATAWFSLRPGSPIVTPHTREFAWTELRRVRVTPQEDGSAEPAKPRE